MTHSTPQPVPLRETALTVAGRDFLADPSGALWCAATRMLVVADLHLEKGSAFAARRRHLPPYDTAETLAALAGVIRRYRPRAVLCLGDSFHDGQAAERMPKGDIASLAAMQSGLDWIWIAGNHDPIIGAAIAGQRRTELIENGIRFAHEPTCGPVDGEVAGHLHPCVNVPVRGTRLRRRAFVSCETRLLMPAFGAFTGGLDVEAPAIRALFPGRRSILALGSARTYRVAA